LIEPRCESRGLGERGERAGEAEGALGEGATEGVEVLAAEDCGEGPDGEEKPRRRGDPARAVGGQGAAGDDTVQVEMLGEILAPRVQDRGAAEVAAEVAGVAPEGREGVDDGSEEQGVEDAGVALGEWVERMRQGEDQVEVLDR
jgi:hypothetical protein